MDFAEQIEHNMYAWMVGQQMFCPYGGQVLDVRTAVVVEEADGIKTLGIFSPQTWAEVKGIVLGKIPDARVVIDGRVNATVVDGEPQYHKPYCPAIKGRDTEEIPYAQAMRDEFTPCERCNT